ncbi:DNA-binding response regulator [Streptomyces sp. Ru71]|uniref:response regulator transcription factor n=1 Tax=Streptomyces sp. Ru71 TaxID=2080746 RepID=UPI000CDDBB87|nr:response regulator transcription factor [Streptomyces sp. Ru71]POX55037.1 DNA-binding response regulator [Streptomyces sp. Ru71]
MRALVVDSDVSGGKSLSSELKRHGFDVQECSTGSEALEIHDKFDLLLVDLRLSDIDGLEVCRTVRAVSDVPIIAFTDSGVNLDRILCLQAGCDDCMAKPYGLRELLARIEAVLRRTRLRAAPAAGAAPLALGSLCIDPETRAVRLNGRPISLTRKEFDLLYRLASEPHTVHSRAQLMADVWGFHSSGYTPGARASRTIDTHVSALRTKLGARDWIVTVRGVGFRFGRP